MECDARTLQFYLFLHKCLNSNMNFNIEHINTNIDAFWSLEFRGACQLWHKSRICENFLSVPAFQEETDGKSNIIIDIIPMLCQYVIAFWMIPFTFIT